MKYDDMERLAAESLLAMAAEVGVAVRPNLRILDYGCGTGRLVEQFRSMGFDAYGADLPWTPVTYGAELSWQHRAPSDGRLRIMTGDPPILPFDADFFDLVVSTSVFEHVREPRFAFEEIHRVTRPGGHSLHIFASRWAPFERHIYVPFAGVFQEAWWFRLWALLGVRTALQKGMGWREVAQANIDYANTGLRYLSRRETREIAESIFGNVTFPVAVYVKHGFGAAAKLARQLRAPIWGGSPFALRERTIHMRKQGHSS